MAPLERTPSALLSSQPWVTSFAGEWKRKWTEPKQNWMLWREQRKTSKKDTRNWKRWYQDWTRKWWEGCSFLFLFLHCSFFNQTFFLLFNRFSRQAEVDRNIELLKKKDEELSEALEKMENQTENNDIDDIIVPTAPLYKQILNLYAEENAIEDTIFYLGEALRRGVIDLEVFLKVTREHSLELSSEPPKKTATAVRVVLFTQMFVGLETKTLNLVAARTSPVQEAVPASCPDAKSPKNSRPEWPVLTHSVFGRHLNVWAPVDHPVLLSELVFY